MKKFIVTLFVGIILFVIYYFRFFFVSLSSVVYSHLSKPDMNYIKENLWQYDYGFKIGNGDFVKFDAGYDYELRHDTIFSKGEPKALVVRTNKYFYQMIITSMDGKLKGEYLNTDEFSQ
jgi:hypothetical protein